PFPVWEGGTSLTRSGYAPDQNPTPIIRRTRSPLPSMGRGARGLGLLPTTTCSQQAYVRPRGRGFLDMRGRLCYSFMLGQDCDPCATAAERPPGDDAARLRYSRICDWFTPGILPPPGRLALAAHAPMAELELGMCHGGRAMSLCLTGGAGL